MRVRTEAGGAVLEEGAPEGAEPVSAVLDEASRTLYLLPAAQSYTPPVSGTPGERTLLNFLKTAMTPVGTTLYVYGGGWNWQDTAADHAASAIGVFTNSLGVFYTPIARELGVGRGAIALHATLSARGEDPEGFVVRRIRRK